MCPPALLEVFWPKVCGNLRLRGKKKNAVGRSITDTLQTWSFLRKLLSFLNLSFQLEQKECVALVDAPHPGRPTGTGTARCCEHRRAVEGSLQFVMVCLGNISSSSPWE